MIKVKQNTKLESSIELVRLSKRALRYLFFKTQGFNFDFVLISLKIFCFRSIGWYKNTFRLLKTRLRISMAICQSKFLMKTVSV